MDKQRCGRPTKSGRPCKEKITIGLPACSNHATADERAELKSREQEALSRAQARRSPVVYPACWSWPVTDADRQRGSLSAWQARRCATCGEVDQLVMDHDHDTGWMRGYLCRGCNTAEGLSENRLFQRYRRWNPARMLSVWRRYDNAFTGLDYGQWHGVPISAPVPVSPSGVVLFDAPRPDFASSLAISRMLERRLR